MNATRKLQRLRKYSSPERVLVLARKYIRLHPVEGDKEEWSKENLIGVVSPNVALYISSRKNKKYTLVMKTKTGNTRTVHFGQIPYEDFTRHHNRSRRKNYLQRATNIKGDWRTDPFSPNNLAIHLLW